jgi:hypothetical protein
MMIEATSMKNQSTEEVNAENAIDTEINEYSIRENVFFITRVAVQLTLNHIIPEIPEVLLMAEVIALAERFEREHGGVENPDSIEVLKVFAEKELTQTGNSFVASSTPSQN